MAQISARKKIVYSLVLLAFLWGVVELVCLGALWYLKKHNNLEYQPQDIEDLNDKHKGNPRRPDRRHLVLHGLRRRPRVDHPPLRPQGGVPGEQQGFAGHP